MTILKKLYRFLLTLILISSWSVQGADEKEESIEILGESTRETIQLNTISIGHLHFPSVMESYLREADIVDYGKATGFGASIGYNRPGCKATVYVYNLGLDKIGQKDIRSAYDAALSDAWTYNQQQESIGNIKNLELQDSFEFTNDALGIFMNGAEMTYGEGNTQRSTFLYFSSMCHEFVKIRSTCDNSALVDGDPTLFTQSLLMSLKKTATCKGFKYLLRKS